MPARLLSRDDPVRRAAAPAAWSAPDDPVRGVMSLGRPLASSLLRCCSSAPCGSAPLCFSPVPRAPRAAGGLRGVTPYLVGCCLAPPRVPWLCGCGARRPGLRHPATVVAWHPVLCRGCGRRRASLGGLLAPHWCAAPRPVRSLSMLPWGFPPPWYLPPPRGLSPPALLGGCAGHAEAGREPGSTCLPLAPAEAGALGLLRVVPVRGPALGLSLAGPSGFGIGLRVLRWFGVPDPVTDAPGCPNCPSFHGGLSRCTGAVSCGRRHLPFRVGGCHARVPCMCACARSCWPGRAGRPLGRVLVRLTVSLAVSSCCLAQPSPGLGRPSCVLFFSLPAPPLSLAFCALRPGVPLALALLFSAAPPYRPRPAIFCFLFFLSLVHRFLVFLFLFLFPPPPCAAFLCCVFFLFFCFFLSCVFFFGGGAWGGFSCFFVLPWGFRPPLLCVCWGCCCAVCVLLLARWGVSPWCRVVPCCCAVPGVCLIFWPRFAACLGACFACAPPPHLPLFLVFCGRLCALLLLCRVCAPSCLCPPWLFSVLLCVRVVLPLLVSCGAPAWCAVWRAPPPPPPGPSLLGFCFVLCRLAVVLVCALLCSVVLVSWGAAAPLGAIVVGRCLVSCSSVPRSRLGRFVWSTALFCAALCCAGFVVPFCSVWCLAVLSWVTLFLLVSCGGPVAPCCLVRCCVVFFWAVWCCGALCRLVCCCAVLRRAGFAVLFVPAPPPPPLLLPLLVGRALRPVVFCHVLPRVWCCVALRRCSRWLLSVLLCAVAFAWCRGVLLCAVLFVLACRGVVALLCVAVRSGALVWFMVSFCALLVLWCIAVWCPAVLCCLWLLRFCWCLAVSCCAVLCGACFRVCGAVVCCCGASFVALCCPGALCCLVCRCAALRCAGFAALSSPPPPPPAAALVVWLRPAFGCVSPCPVVRVVLCCAALLLSFLLFFLFCAVAIAWFRGALLCAVLLLWLFCGAVALPCCVL